MFSSGWRGARAAVITGVSAAVVLGGGALGVTVAAAHSQTATPRAATAATATTRAAATAPWSSAGAGWVLDMYSARTKTKAAPTTLYLVSPGGAKYALYTWKASGTPAPDLIAWAGSKTEALFQLVSAHSGPRAAWEEMNLRTGKLTRVALAKGATPLGFTLPTGQQILGGTHRGATATIARYTQAGARVKTLVTENVKYNGGFSPAVVYSGNGTELAVGAANGLLLVSNAGGVLRKLTVPGADPKLGCTPERWWTATVILASCTPKNTAAFAPQLFLVPASGARPSALTPVRKSGFDLGDIGAWRLSSGLYLQSLGPCGTLEINRQANNGSVTRVLVPGETDSPVVVTANKSQLLVAQSGCDGAGGQLAWFNPATKAERWLFKTGSYQLLAYNSTENSIPR